jgi:hypothetical protein
MLEPYDGKLSRTVLRGERGRKAPDPLGAVNVAETGPAACKSRTALAARDASALPGYHRCHGETR